MNFEFILSKKKRKPEISPPTDFVHRVHTDYDKIERRYVGLPLQWASIIADNQNLKSINRYVFHIQKQLIGHHVKVTELTKV